MASAFLAALTLPVLALPQSELLCIGNAPKASAREGGDAVDESLTNGTAMRRGADKRTARVACRMTEGYYMENHRWKTVDAVRVSANGDYVWKFYHVWKTPPRGQKYKGQVPPSLLQPLLASASTFPVQDGVRGTNLCLDSSFTIPHPKGVDAVLAYLKEKHLSPFAGYDERASVAAAEGFFERRRAEAVGARIEEAACSLKRTCEFWQGKPRHTAELRRVIERQRAVAIQDIIATMRKRSGEHLGDSANAWIEKYHAERCSQADWPNTVVEGDERFADPSVEVTCKPAYYRRLNDGVLVPADEAQLIKGLRVDGVVLSIVEPKRFKGQIVTFRYEILKKWDYWYKPNVLYTGEIRVRDIGKSVFICDPGWHDSTTNDLER